MQGYTFLKNSFLCLLLSKQSKRKVIEKKPHCDTETKKPNPGSVSWNRTNYKKMQFSMSMFNFPFFFPLFEQILVSAQSSAQPHIQEQGREAANKPHLGFVIPTRQLELLREALGLHGNAS